jgi:ABC-type multidrug transport system fused ATPase/permease subunit
MNGVIPMKPMGKLTELFSALRRFFTSSHKRQLLKVSGWACLLSCLEMLLAAAVIPYVQCLGGACPETAHKLAGVLGWPAVQALSLGLIVLITMKLGVQALLTWEGSDLNQRVQRDTVIQLLEGYLHLNWTSFRSRHATHYFRRCATTAIDAAYVTQQCVTMISSVLLLLFLVGLMLWTYPVASIALATFAGLNIFTQRLVGNKQNRIAQERELALQRWSIGMTEAFALFREIRVYSLERFFLSQMDRSIKKLAYANQRSVDRCRALVGFATADRGIGGPINFLCRRGPNHCARHDQSAEHTGGPVRSDHQYSTGPGRADLGRRCALPKDRHCHCTLGKRTVCP